MSAAPPLSSRRSAHYSRTIPPHRQSLADRQCFFETLEDRRMLAGLDYADFSDQSQLSLVDDASVTRKMRFG